MKMFGENRGGVIELLFMERLVCDRLFTGSSTCMIVMNLHSNHEVHTFTVPLLQVRELRNRKTCPSPHSGDLS